MPEETHDASSASGETPRHRFAVYSRAREGAEVSYQVNQESGEVRYQVRAKDDREAAEILREAQEAVAQFLGNV